MSKHTDLKLLKKGLIYMVISLPLLITSPYLITLAFLNKETYVLYIALAIGIIAGSAAIYLCFKGLNTIMKSIF